MFNPEKFNDFPHTPNEVIVNFSGENSYLSNMEELQVPIPTPYGDVPTSEHAYIIEKLADPVLKGFIAKIRHGKQAKSLARKLIESGAEVTPGWQDNRIEVMRRVVTQKFVLNPDLADKLVQTGDAIIEEGNTRRDTFWGVCPPGSGNGANNLGKIIMSVRENLQQQSTES